MRVKKTSTHWQASVEPNRVERCLLSSYSVDIPNDFLSASADFASIDVGRLKATPCDRCSVQAVHDSTNTSTHFPYPIR